MNYITCYKPPDLICPIPLSEHKAVRKVLGRQHGIAVPVTSGPSHGEARRRWCTEGFQSVPACCNPTGPSMGPWLVLKDLIRVRAPYSVTRWFEMMLCNHGFMRVSLGACSRGPWDLLWNKTPAPKALLC